MWWDLTKNQEHFAKARELAGDLESSDPGAHFERFMQLAGALVFLTLSFNALRHPG